MFKKYFCAFFHFNIDNFKQVSFVYLHTEYPVTICSLVSPPVRVWCYGLPQGCYQPHPDWSQQVLNCHMTKINMYITCFTVLESEKMIPFKKETRMVDFENILLGKIVFVRV